MKIFISFLILVFSYILMAFRVIGNGIEPRLILFNKSVTQQVFGLLLVVVFLVYELSTISINPTWAVSNPVTPTPTKSEGSPCKAVVTYSWDISGISNANRVFWELKKGSDFSNLEGRESGRLAGQGSNNVPTGNVTLDLRNYGQVLNGTKYYFRVVAKNGTQDVARRSDSVEFNLDKTPDGTFSAQVSQQNPNQVELSWNNLQPDIKNCSDHIFFEVKKNSNFSNFTGAESQRVKWGPASGTSTTIDMSGEEPGNYYVRIVGKSGGNQQRDDVGKRGNGILVTIGQQAPTPPQPTPTPTPTPTTPPPSFQSVNITTQPLKMTGLREESTPAPTPTQPSAGGLQPVTDPVLAIIRARYFDNNLSSVYLHPRCVNCHGGVNPATFPATSPNHPTISTVCSSCHRVDGQPFSDWSNTNAPNFANKNANQICNIVKNSAQATSRTAFQHHLEEDPLIDWAFFPTALPNGSVPASAGNKSDFVDKSLTWFDMGKPCGLELQRRVP